MGTRNISVIDACITFQPSKSYSLMRLIAAYSTIVLFDYRAKTTNGWNSRTPIVRSVSRSWYMPTSNVSWRRPTLMRGRKIRANIIVSSALDIMSSAPTMIRCRDTTNEGVRIVWNGS
ncbi:uncharacterized protein [Venturia canescens]|uniref:uncharacterized protein n=1 Tax=Venturia canescens TaxID=32260 RepID=UPI001C9D59A2|nr:uncharacterized protein LOC122411403 [Venturia canescens]